MRERNPGDKYKIVLVGYLKEDPRVIHSPKGIYYALSMETKTMDKENKVLSTNEHYVSTEDIKEQDKLKLLRARDLVVVRGYRVPDSTRAYFIYAYEVAFRYPLSFKGIGRTNITEPIK